MGRGRGAELGPERASGRGERACGRASRVGTARGPAACAWGPGRARGRESAAGTGRGGRGGCARERIGARPLPRGRERAGFGPAPVLGFQKRLLLETSASCRAHASWLRGGTRCRGPPLLHSPARCPGAMPGPVPLGAGSQGRGQGAAVPPTHARPRSGFGPRAGQRRKRASCLKPHPRHSSQRHPGGISRGAWAGLESKASLPAPAGRPASPGLCCAMPSRAEPCRAVPGAAGAPRVRSAARLEAGRGAAAGAPVGRGGRVGGPGGPGGLGFAERGFAGKKICGGFGAVRTAALRAVPRPAG